jgi:hypothetical protein
MTVPDELKPQKPFPVACCLSPLKDFFSKPYVSTESDPLPTLLPPGVVSTALSRLRNHKSVQPLRYLSPNEIDRHCLQSGIVYCTHSGAGGCQLPSRIEGA